MTLPEFLATTGGLTVPQREDVVDQAILLISGLYAHLPLKRAMHAIDPVQRLRLLRHRLARLSDRRFHDEMISIFTGLRDLHTNYMLPDPFRSKTAFLPFFIEEFWEKGVRRYLVSKTHASLTHPTFQRGVVVTHWNGIPIERAVELNAERNAGGNPAARHANGLQSLTHRPMLMSCPPDEEWVDVGYLAGGQKQELRFPWKVFTPGPAPGGLDPKAGHRPSAHRLGIDLAGEVARRGKKMLFAPAAMAAERRLAGSVPAAALAQQSKLPDVLSFRTVTTPSGRFGYLRIWNFLVDDNENAFVNEVIRILGLLPDQGLILDVRGNPGGDITAGERLLQLFTPRSIQPELLHFINTPLALDVARNDPSMKPWVTSMENSLETGAVLSQGFPMEPVELCNRIGQKYTGPVLLITNPMCYSATDIFTAGFQDHNLGPILGTADDTGAGGANVWTFEVVRSMIPGKKNPFRSLPRNTSFRVAVRRTTRVGKHAGMPLEELGVVPDSVHKMTRNDLLNDNVDLINEAGGILSRLPVRRLAAQAKTRGTRLQVVVKTTNLDRLDVFLDGRPQMTRDVKDGVSVFALKMTTPPAKELELRGFAANELVASRRVPL